MRQTSSVAGDEAAIAVGGDADLGHLGDDADLGHSGGRRPQRQRDGAVLRPGASESSSLTPAFYPGAVSINPISLVQTGDPTPGAALRGSSCLDRSAVREPRQS